MNTYFRILLTNAKSHLGVFITFIICYLAFSLAIRETELGIIPFVYASFFFLICTFFLGRHGLSLVDFRDFRLSLVLCIVVLVVCQHSIYHGTSGLWLPKDLKYLLSKGYFNTDSSWHLALIESIKTNGFPSVMVHGTPPQSYHLGSHYLLAVMSAASGIPVLELFPFQNSFFATIFMAYFLTIVSKKNEGIMLIFAGGLFLFANKMEQFFWAFDVSMPISLFWGFLLLLRYNNFGVQNNRRTFLASLALLFLSSYSKISTGIYILGVFTLFNIFQNKSKPIKIVTNSLLAGLVFLFAFWLVSDPHTRGVNLNWEFNSLYNQLLTQEKRDANVLFFFLLPTILFFISVLVKETPTAVCSVGIILGTALMINISFQNRNHMHFVIAANFISLFLFARLPRLFPGRPNGEKLYLMFLISTLILTMFPYSEKKKTFTDEAKRFSQKTDASLYINRLFELRDSNENFLIHIPESEKDFWDHSPWAPRYFMPFWIPMISSKPAYKGYNADIMKNQRVGWYPVGAYGYANYYDYEPDLDKYEYILRLEKEKGYLKETKIPIARIKNQQ